MRFTVYLFLMSLAVSGCSQSKDVDVIAKTDAGTSESAGEEINSHAELGLELSAKVEASPRIDLLDVHVTAIKPSSMKILNVGMLRIDRMETASGKVLPLPKDDRFHGKNPFTWLVPWVQDPFAPSSLFDSGIRFGDDDVTLRFRALKTAEAIGILEGAFQVQTADVEDVTIDSLVDWVGKSVEHPGLKDPAIKAAVSRRYLVDLRSTGEQVAAAQLTNETAPTPVRKGVWRWIDNGLLPENAGLRLWLAKDLVATDVAFDFADLEMPARPKDFGRVVGAQQTMEGPNGWAVSARASWPASVPLRPTINVTIQGDGLSKKLDYGQLTLAPIEDRNGEELRAGSFLGLDPTKEFIVSNPGQDKISFTIPYPREASFGEVIPRFAGKVTVRTPSEASLVIQPLQRGGTHNIEDKELGISGAYKWSESLVVNFVTSIEAFGGADIVDANGKILASSRTTGRRRVDGGPAQLEAVVSVNELPHDAALVVRAFRNLKTTTVPFRFHGFD